MRGSIVDAASTAMTLSLHFTIGGCSFALRATKSMLRSTIELPLSLLKPSLKAERHRSLFVETTGSISPVQWPASTRTVAGYGGTNAFSVSRPGSYTFSEPGKFISSC